MKLTQTGQVTFSFYAEHFRSLEAKREKLRRQRVELAAQRRRERRGSLRHTLDLMDLPPDYLTRAELHTCDTYIARSMAAIRDSWTPHEEAQRRGVDIRQCARVFFSDGRVFQYDYTVASVATGDLWVDSDDFEG